jgi:hypothetical protein
MSVIFEPVRKSKIIQAVKATLWTPDIVIGRDDPEYKRQADILASAYAGEVGKSPAEYQEDLPDQLIIRGSFLGKGVLRLGFLVQPPIPEIGLTVERMIEITQVTSHRPPFTLNDWSGDRQGYQTPDRPYSAAMGFVEISSQAPAKYRSRMPETLRGGSLSDALALVLHAQGTKNEKSSIALLGMSIEDPRFPTPKKGTDLEDLARLYWEKGKARLDLTYANCEGLVDSGLVVTRDIQLGKPQFIFQ